MVGGGAAGVHIARSLASKLDSTMYKLVLINPRPFRILLPATLRTAVSDIDNLGTTAGALVPYDKIFHGDNGTFLQESIHSIQEKGLTLGSGEQVLYDILLVVDNFKTKLDFVVSMWKLINSCSYAIKYIHFILMNNICV